MMAGHTAHRGECSMKGGSGGRKKAGTAHNRDYGMGIPGEMKRRQKFGLMGNLSKAEEKYFYGQQDEQGQLRAEGVIRKVRALNKRKGVSPY